MSGLEIAIVGLAARLPGAGNVDAYWNLLLTGREGITRLSDAELRAAGLDEKRLSDASTIKALGLLEDVDRFDAAFFGYSEKDAELLDPQQRLFLEHAWTALENGGFVAEKFDGAIGVFAGCGLSTYTLRLVANGWLVRQKIGFQKAIANDKDHLTTTAAYKLGLTGPAITVQTTCSTSLVAVHLACRSLLSGECDMALAGGVTVGLERGSVPSYQEGNILSMDGHCRPFDAQASGTVVSNGVGIVVLRRLDDSIRDKDNIRAVIRASAINNDGATKVGYLSPSVSGQSQVIGKALHLAGVHPDTIDYVEAHGTATLKGDPIELRALTRAYRGYTARKQYCALGSVKGNIGHTDAAAGVAGLIKAVMAIEHATIPATPHFRAPNQDLALEDSPFYVNKTTIPWPRADRPRRAAVSSFGLGGTNAHLILEQAPERPTVRASSSDQLVLLSAKSRSALKTLAGCLASSLQDDANILLEDVAFTLRQGRADLRERAFFLGVRDEIIHQLLAFETKAPSGDSPGASHQPTWIVEGTLERWRTLISAYFDACPSFSDLVTEHEPIFSAAGVSISEQFLTGSLALADNAVTRLAAGYLLGTHLLRLGIDLQAILPTEENELVAACVAGALRIEEGLDIACLLSGRAQNSLASATDTSGGTLTRSLTPQPPRISYFSQVTGKWHTAGSVQDNAYWEDLCRPRILHSSEDREPAGNEGLCLIRMGVIGTEQREPSSEADQRPAGDVFDLFCNASTPAALNRRALRVVGELWRRGHVLRRDVLSGRRIVLPTYPFEGKRYWIDGEKVASTVVAEYAASSVPKFPVVEHLYVPAWRQCVATRPAFPPDAELSSRGHDQYVVFAAPDDPLATALADALRGTPLRLTFVQDVRGGTAGSDGFSIDGTSGNDYTMLVRRFALSKTHVNRFVFFDSFLEALEPAFGRHGPGPWFCAPMFLAQALGDVLLEGDFSAKNWPSIELLLVSKAMWTLDGEEPIQPERALTRALGTVIAQEYPNIVFRTIDLPASNSDAYASGPKRNLLLAELCETRESHEVRHDALRGRHRWEQFFVPVGLDVLGPSKLRSEGVYLITGGLGGIGLNIAEYLAREVRARLVLVGRSEFPADSERLTRIREIGGEVLVFSADVTSRSAMLEVKHEAGRAFGRINGIVHAAGCMPESIVQRMTGASAWRVLQAKVAGTRVLAKLFDGESLDFLCLFSSLRSMTGGVGNGDYAAANAYMDAFAEKAWVEGKNHVFSINWDGWANVGMTTRVKQDVAGPTELMSVDQALHAFAAALRLSCPRVAVSSVPIDDLLADSMAHAGERGGWIESASTESTANTGVGRPEFLELPYVGPRTKAEAAMVSIWEQQLGIKPVGVLDSFSALGGDSVTSLQITAKAAEAGLRIGPFQVLECDTIEALCQQLETVSSVVAGEGPAAVTGVVPLTPIQHWFFDRKLIKPSYFNQAFVLRPLRKLDEGHLHQAFEALLRHHDALRSRFSRTADGWTQYQVEQPYAPFRIEDLQHLEPDARRERMADICAAEQQALDLDKPELVRLVLFDCGRPTDDRLLICAHHLVVDAISWTVLMDDLQTSYLQLERGEPIRLPAKSTAFKFWSESLQAYKESGAALANRDYWAHTLGANRRRLPRDFIGVDNTVGSSAIIFREIGLDRNTTPAGHGVKGLSIFLAALGSTLEDWAGPGSVLIDLEGHGRTCTDVDADLSRTVGWFTALHPLAIPSGRERPHEETLADVQAAVDAVPNRGVDYGVLTYLSNDPIRHEPSAEVLVLYLGQGSRGASDDPLLEMTNESPGWTQDPANLRSHILEVVASPRDTKVKLSITYSKQLHNASTIEWFVDRLLLSYQSFASHAYCAQEA